MSAKTLSAREAGRRSSKPARFRPNHRNEKLPVKTHTPAPACMIPGRAAFCALALLPLCLGAQTAPAAASAAGEDDVIQLEAVAVTGSNIKRMDVEKVLPVTVFSSDMIQARDATTPVDLLQALPEVTNIPQNETSLGANSGRGGNANVALRGLGAANTLILLNGRRMPFFPISTSSVNVNTLPTFGLSQVEVLRDGASSIYGTDAIAGVINYVTNTETRGTQVSVRYGVTEHGGGMDIKGDIGYGTTFAEGKGTWLTNFSAYYRDKIWLVDREISKSNDRSNLARPPFDVTGAYNGQSATGTSQYTAFFVGVNEARTSATHRVFPLSENPSDPWTINPTPNTPRSLWYNSNDKLVGQPRTSRYNFFNRVEYALSDNLQLFGEAVAYLSQSQTNRAPPTITIPDIRVVMGVENPFNPFGTRFYSTTGAPNLDGTPRLTGAPQPITIVSTMITEHEKEIIDAEERVYRVLGGLRGKIGSSSWTWETAAMVGGVRATEFARIGIRDSLIMASALSTDLMSAWNPFGTTFKVQNGQVVPDRKYRNPQGVIDSFTQPIRRFAYSKIATWDLSVNGNAFDLWAGPVAVAAGVDWRYEKKQEFKDPFAGVNPPDSGLDPQNNDFVLLSPKGDYRGTRTIASGFAETVVPLVRPDNDLPLLNTLEVNAAIRHERYSDFGDTTNPKFGVNWKPFPFVMVRASINKGFKAPDFQDLHQPSSFSGAQPPGVRDEARNNYLTSAGRPADVQVQTKNYTVTNKDLKPETSEGRSAGVVVDVPWVRGLSFTVDYWEITQDDLVVGLTTTAGLDQQLLHAYTQQQLAAGKDIMQIDFGSKVTPSSPTTYVGDPYVLRHPVSAEDRALFAPTYATLPQSQWIAPMGMREGQINRLENSAGRNFTNGFDYSVSYSLPPTPMGQFRVSTSWSQFLNKFTKSQPNFPKNDDIERMILPEWKGSATLQWRQGNWNATANITYNSDSRTGATTNLANYQAAGSPDYIVPIVTINSVGAPSVAYVEKGESQTQVNFGLGYRFGPDASSWVKNTSFRLGVNNVFDKEPALSAPNAAGFTGATGSSLWVGRAYSLTVTRDF